MVLDQWKEMALATYKQQPRLNKHWLLDQLDLSPFATLESTEKKDRVPQLPMAPTDFWNVSMESEVLTEAGAQLGMSGALWLGSEKDGTLPHKIYLSASPQMLPWKLNVTKRAWESGGQVDCGVDPYGLGLWESKIYKTTAAPAQDLSQSFSFFRLSGVPYHLAGADDIQQLAILIASVAQLLRDYDGVLEPQAIVDKLSLEVAMDADVFIGAAKLQSLRFLFGRLLEVSQLKGTPKIFALLSPRHMSRREPWNNILRLTSVNMAARMGGIHGVVQLPYDALSKNSKEQRLSRNMDLILGLESHFHRVQDPLSGSFSAQEVIDKLCQHAWRLFTELEKKGGLVSCLRSGWLQDEIERSRLQQKSLLQMQKLKMIGLNDYVLTRGVDPKYPLGQQENTWTGEEWWIQYQSTSPVAKLADVKKLKPELLADEFEDMQFSSDQMREKLGEDFKVQLFVEPGDGLSKKVAQVKKRLNLLAIEACEDCDPSPVAIVVASDPEGEFVTRIQSQRQDSHGPCLLIWAGERVPKGFQLSTGGPTSLNTLHAQLIKAFEESRS
jgi:hypothetical protein